MKKLLLSFFVLLLIATSAFAEKTYTLSISQIVEHPSLDAIRNGLLDRLKEKGLLIQSNIHIAQGNSATNTQITSQIMGEEPDLVIAITTPSAQAVAQKIKQTPILFTGVTDPVSAGLVKDLQNSQGTNITGMSDFYPMDKQVALIQTIIPKATSVGVIYNAGEPNSVVLINKFKEQAEKQGLTIEEATIANSSGVYQAAKSLVGRSDVIFIPTDNTAISALESALKVCKQNRLPLIVSDVDSVARGAIAAVAFDYYKMGLQSGDMAYRILVGETSPAHMPIEFLNDMTLHVNKTAAAAMGVKIPESLLKQAEKVIE